ncbi:MAG: hypothetical protein HOQ32_12520 [Lysobacter sp.]|nr:hypothetical protein [Lysobacter sp.]
MRRLRGWFGKRPAVVVAPPRVLSDDEVERAVLVFGEGERSDRRIEADMRALAGDAMTARRLVDVVPEAFGLLLIAHIPACAGVVMPDGFQAQDADGRWHEFPWEREPVFAQAAQIAARMFHEGPRARFQAIATRGSMIAAVNNALEQESDLADSTLGAPAFLGLPAELYLERQP